MTASDILYINSLQCENVDLRRELEAFRNGEKYKKLRHDYDMVLRGKDRRISDLEKELAELDLHHKKQREQWFEDNERWLKEYYQKVDRYIKENERLKDLRVKDNIEWNEKVTEMAEHHAEELRERALAVLPTQF